MCHSVWRHYREVVLFFLSLSWLEKQEYWEKKTCYLSQWRIGSQKSNKKHWRWYEKSHINLVVLQQLISAQIFSLQIHQICKNCFWHWCVSFSILMTKLVSKPQGWVSDSPCKIWCKSSPRWRYNTFILTQLIKQFSNLIIFALQIQHPHFLLVKFDSK